MTEEELLRKIALLEADNYQLRERLEHQNKVISQAWTHLSVLESPDTAEILLSGGMNG